MELVRRRAGSLLAIGLILALAWSAAVTLSMPSWFDPTEACTHKFPAAADSADVSVRTRWFPPAASCDFDGDVRQFMSPARGGLLVVAADLVQRHVQEAVQQHDRHLGGLEPRQGGLQRADRGRQ